MLNNYDLDLEQILVVSDIHGMYTQLKNLLEAVASDIPILFLGDYLDRGSDSKKVLDLIRSTVENDKGIAIKGNHEQMCLDALNDSHTGDLSVFESYLLRGGDTTVKSFTGLKYNKYKKNKKEHLIELHKEFKKVMVENGYVDFLESLPYFITMGELLFIHAGVDAKTKGLEDIKEEEALWVREEFYANPHSLDYKIVFGHSVVNNLPQFKEENCLWISNNKIGIDGGSCFGGFLNGCLFNSKENTIKVLSAFTDTNARKVVKERNLIKL